jgi:hypothetical protein
MPAAAAGRPCRQPPRASRDGSHRGPGRQPWADMCRPVHRSQDAPVEEPAGNCISFRQPTLPEEGGGSGVGGRGGTCELGLRSLSHPRHVRSRTFRRMHGPQGTDRHIRTAAALRACALSGARARALSGARACARAERRACMRARACARAERSGARRGARGSTVHARGATRSVSRAHRASTMP